MHIHFLGTGAADWRPSDTHFRAFSSLLVDDELLIDGTTSVQPRILHPERIRDILYTHSHFDHFDAELLKTLAPVRAHIHSSWANTVHIEGIQVIPFESMETFTAGNFRVTALPSNHLSDNANEETVHFVVERENKSLFYATDGAWLTCREWHGLQAFSLDAAVFDATIGDLYPGDYRIFEHNSLEMIRIMLRTMRCPRSAGEPLNDEIHPVLKKEAPVFLTHLARTLHAPDEELRKQLDGEFVLGFDGLTADI